MTPSEASMTPASSKGRLMAAFRKEQARLVRLMNDAPTDAVAAARKLRRDSKTWLNLRATILADAGAAAKDLSAVQEAHDIFVTLHEETRDPDTAYNLSNALASLAKLDTFDGADWYLRTAAKRRDSRTFLAEAAAVLTLDKPELASQAYTNLGNALSQASRWVEAYEMYQRALTVLPTNGVASGCAARGLLRIASQQLFRHDEHACSVATRLAYHAQQHADVVRDFAGTQAVSEFAKLPSSAGELLEPPKHASSEYARFVSANRLVLAPVVEGLGEDSQRWDDAHIDALSEPVGSDGVPPVFAMFNVLKADYLLAREMLFESISMEETVSDTGVYFDTLDYALYGRKTSLLALARRAALDLLDKIAVALNEYLGLGIDVDDVYFRSLWYEPKTTPLRWRSVLRDEVAAGNTALVALSEIASDLSGEISVGGTQKGFLHEHRKTRNASTHRFLVLHDFARDGFRPSASIEHRDLVEFETASLDTLRLVRAALLYSLEVIARREKRSDRKHGLALPMMLVPHHKVRGLSRPRASRKKTRRGRS